MKKWYNCELNREEYEKFRVFLKENGIKYEPSGCGNLVHVEMYMDQYEYEITENFLCSL